MWSPRSVGNIRDLANAASQGCNNGALVDHFGVLIQAVLGMVAFSTLMLKRWKEPKDERRPWKIWFYDTSKQAIGALFIHFTNVYLSDLTEEDPCSLYLMNFLLDATLGMFLIWINVKIVSVIVERQQFTILVFGEYGDPPQASAWLGQCGIYFLILIIEKSIISFVLLIPGWTKLQEIVLNYIPDPQLELVLVMLVVPFIVNALMFWVVDSLIMRKHKRVKVNDDPEKEFVTKRYSHARNEESQTMLLSQLEMDQILIRPLMQEDQEEQLDVQQPSQSGSSLPPLSLHGTAADMRNKIMDKLATVTIKKKNTCPSWKMRLEAKTMATRR
ncbi:store-operated calcium entry regulator STIMATE-like [Pelodytes ibericus]